MTHAERIDWDAYTAWQMQTAREYAEFVKTCNSFEECRTFIRPGATKPTWAPAVGESFLCFWTEPEAQKIVNNAMMARVAELESRATESVVAVIEQPKQPELVEHAENKPNLTMFGRLKKFWR